MGSNQQVKDEFDDILFDGVEDLLTSIAGLVDVPYDNWAVTSRNADGEPLTIDYKLAAAVVKTITLTYDATFGNVDTAIAS